MRIWTPEARQRQAELIRSWKPWTHSTGAKTEAGKAIVSQNRQKSLDRAKAEIEQARQDYFAKVKALTRIRGGG